MLDMHVIMTAVSNADRGERTEGQTPARAVGYAGRIERHSRRVLDTVIQFQSRKLVYF